MEKVKAAIAGLGRIASLLEDDSLREKPCTHAGAIDANPDCILSGGCDTDGERRRLFAERWSAPVYEDAAEMLKELRPQIFVIATHPDSHYYYCRLASDCGVPVVICEKPLADTRSAARKIVCLAETTETVFITNHERRYSADYLKAREILAGGKLGEILSVRAVLYMGKNKRLLDVFWHDGTHLADAVMFLSGAELKYGKRYGAKLVSRAGTAFLASRLEKRTPDGKGGGRIPVIFEIGAGRDHLVFEIEFSCSAGRLRIGNGVFEVWESEASPYAEKFRSLKRSADTFEGKTGYFANMIADAVACAREKGRVPVSSAADGLKVIEYLHAATPWLN